MELLTQLLNALWAQDFETLANPSMIGMLYFVLFTILFLENGLLPAAFLPGDSLLVLVGVLIAKGAMGFPQTVLLLTTAASLGCWLSYIQGCRTFLRITINAHIIFFISMACLRCWLVASLRLSEHYCRPSQGYPA